MEVVLPELPMKFYFIVGVLIVMNLGTLGSIIFAAIRLTWWLSGLNHKADDAKGAAVRAHKRIDQLEERISK